jgi:hypothetical protein
MMRVLSVLFIVLTVAIGQAQAATSYQVSSGATVTITEYSACAVVTNSHASGLALFVPTGSAAEWTAFRAAPGTGVTAVACDTTPNAFLFSDVTEAEVSTVISSGVVTINGMNAPAPVTVTGDAEFRISGGSWVTTGTIANGQTIEIRLTSSSSASSTVSTIVSVGGVTDTWSVTTVAASEPNVVFLTTGSSWTVPADWNSGNNTIEVIGAGGGGSSGSGGAGGGGYSKVSNIALVPGSSIAYGIGAGGVKDVNGGDTWLCSSSLNCGSSDGSGVVVMAKGGRTRAISVFGESGGPFHWGIGIERFSGGSGGKGGSSASDGGGGGGGAAGPGHNGKAGGYTAVDGGGGGGGGGGTSSSNGGLPSSNDGGVGGAGPSGVGGGATNGGAGATGGGGGGGTDNGTEAGGGGGSGVEWATHGVGGGGGGGADAGPGGAGGIYGGGGGGAGSDNSSGAGGVGGKGLIRVSYSPGAAPSQSCNLTAGTTWTSYGNVCTVGSNVSIGYGKDGTVSDNTGPTKGSAKFICNSGTIVLSGEHNCQVDSFTQVANMPVAKNHFGAALLGNGKVFMCGGYSSSAGSGLNRCDVYDAGANSFTQVANLPEGKKYFRAARLQNNHVLMCGGITGTATYSSKCYTYNESTNAFSQVSDMPTARDSFAVETLLDGRVLFCGGSIGGTTTDRCDIYDPGTNTFTQSANLPLARRYLGSARLTDGQVLFCGGRNSSGNETSNCYKYDPGSNSFSNGAVMVLSLREHTMSTLADGRVHVCGGWSRTDYCAMYGPDDDIFVMSTAMPDRKNEHVSVVMSDGRELICGGTISNAVSSRCDIYTP